jgi:hypothetical protein
VAALARHPDLEPAARVAHTNEPILSISLRLFLMQGLSFGIGRSASWPALRRAAYLLCSPAIPAMNLPRVLRDAAHALPAGEALRSLPSIALHVTAHGAGKALGYLTRRFRDEDFLHAHEFAHRPQRAESA